jgi:alpha-galactosidase/6-phospho-beta-glucosidase family protein
MTKDFKVGDLVTTSPLNKCECESCVSLSCIPLRISAVDGRTVRVGGVYFDMRNIEHVKDYARDIERELAGLT